MSKTKQKIVNPDKMPWYTIIAWPTRGISLSCNIIVLGFLTYYCTNLLKMDPILVGMLLLASKLFDGVTDLAAGFLVDKTNTRFGKARPYEFAIIGVWVCTILMFACPDLGVVGKSIWIFVTYTFVNSVFATLLNADECVYLARAIKLESDRNILVSVNGLLITLFCTIVSIIFPILMGGPLGETPSGWTTIVMIFAVPLGVIGLGRFAFVKERKDADSVAAGQKIDGKAFMKALKTNPFIFILAGATLFSQIITNMGTAVGTYYFDYIVGDVEKMSVVGTLSLISPFVLLLMPALLKKLTLSQTVIAGSVLGIIGSAIKGFAGANMGMLIIGNFLVLVAALPLAYYGAIMVVSCMDYSEWKNGDRIEGAFASVNGFASKVGSGLASVVVGFVMGAAGFDADLAVQPTAVLDSVVALASWIPLAMFIIIIILMVFYKLDKMMPQIREELDARHQQNQ